MSTSKVRNLKATASEAASHLLEAFSNKSLIRRQLIDANQLQKLTLTLNRPTLDGTDISEHPPSTGTPVPPGYHLVYFTPNGTESELGADGSDTTFNASAPFTRRMWAGGKMTWAKDVPLCVGDYVEERTKLLSATPKKSKTVGEMVLVDVEKEFWTPKGLALTDRRSWVFRPEIDPSIVRNVPEPLENAVPGASLLRDLTAKANSLGAIREFRWSPVALFRFSALTFNGHMIHYNQDWTRTVEGHPSLVVHGPLNLINLLDCWRDIYSKGKSVRDITYRALSPLYAGETYTARTLRTGGNWTEEGWEIILEKDGEICMKSEITAHK
ncbi:hypothetical protein F66182_7119 [Fusarium sp. NRRL 66182]|nr:hypothetical protein F66182_7119 [Fusarium sp. NRRL 66182]